jgi:hypothetical protein
VPKRVSWWQFDGRFAHCKPKGEMKKDIFNFSGFLEILKMADR